jgi:rhodanese-related sulfurtransferase
MRASHYADLTAAEAKAVVESDLDLVVLDVRTPAEYSSGHLRNARLIPVNDLAQRRNELNKLDRILVYCRLGVRSRRASEILAHNGFVHVYNMLGGITAWTEAGFPVYSKQSSLKRTIARVRFGFRQLLLRV